MNLAPFGRTFEWIKPPPLTPPSQGGEPVLPLTKGELEGVVLGFINPKSFFLPPLCQYR